MHRARVLVAGVGNVFFGDDGFGVELARRLVRDGVPAGAAVLDIGIRGLHLAYELLEPYQAVIIADAVARGDRPGTLYVIDPALESAPERRADPHGMDLAGVLATARSLGAALSRLTIVGCEPARVEEHLGLSPAVEGAIDRAAALIRGLVLRELDAAAATHNEEDAR